VGETTAAFRRLVENVERVIAGNPVAATHPYGFVVNYQQVLPFILLIGIIGSGSFDSTSQLVLKTLFVLLPVIGWTVSIDGRRSRGSRWAPRGSSRLPR
jgi:hypothetical protein